MKRRTGVSTQVRGIGIRLCIGLFAAGVGLSCSTLKAVTNIFEDPRPQAATQAPPRYQQGVKHLALEDYKGALEAFDEFLREKPTSPYTQVAVFNSGRALEGLERWSEAEAKYRSVVQATNKAPKLQALALYRSSFCYEAAGDDPRTIAALVDSRNRASYLPEEIAAAELPARLAASYARVGNIDEAMKHYAQAEAGISRLKNRAANQKMPEWLPRTLYYMGRMSLRKVSWEDFEIALRPVEKAQGYLLQAAELDAGKFSAAAADEIKRVYGEIKSVIETTPAGKDQSDVIAKREVQTRQLEMIELTFNALRELRAMHPPAEKDRSAKLDEVFDYVANLEKALVALIDQPRAGEGLTPESRARRERVRGRVVAPSDELERKYMERSQLPAKKKKKRNAEPPPALDATSGDPNL